MIHHNNNNNNGPKIRRKEEGGTSFARRLQFSRSSCTLRKETRDKVLQVTKFKDPYDPELQGAFTEFVQHVDELEEDEIDLPEVSLLLRGATKIYTSQVDSLVNDINTLLEHCTRTKKASLERKKVKKLDEQPTVLEDGEGPTLRNKQLQDVILQDSNHISIDDCEDNDQTKSDSGIEDTEKSPEPESEILGELSDDISDKELPLVEVDTITIDDDPESFPLGENPVPELNGVPVGENGEVVLNGMDLANAEGVNNTQIGSQNEEQTPKKRKLRNGLVLPPTLVSCFEEWDDLVLKGIFDDRDINHLIPPYLDKAFRTSKRKLYSEDFFPLPMPPLPKKAKETIDGECFGDAEDVTEDKEQLDISEDIKPDISSLGFSHLTQEFPSAAAASFSSEDQAIIQDCINDLHYLPFTFGLSKNALSSAFSRTVDRMSDVFKKNNVPVTRHMVKEASVIATSSEKSEKVKDIHPVAHNLGDIYNTFVKMCRQECETYITNSSISIMERHKEKSFAESRANIRSMISELQRNIVPKFARVPLMAENTPEFFQHVTNFEKKMKKILEEDAKKDEFDVRKYEREVLEVTAKESSEQDRYDDFLVPNSPPHRPQSVAEDHFEPLISSPSTRSSFDGSQSSIGANSWVPLKHIFYHMKSIDRTETARSFYAVLALLSYQNLDINYDQLYSHESAALMKKQFSATNNEDEMDSKFPRGVKICTSRCPDADKEEVFIAALTSESRDEAFRQLLAQETRNMAIRDGATGTLRYNESKIDEGIAEAMADFVEETSTVFTGRLHARRRKKKVVES